MSMANTFLQVILPSGNLAIYEVQPQYFNEFAGLSLNQRAFEYGEQIAVKNAGIWYRGGTGLREEITDPKTIKCLEKTRKAYEVQA
jgi:hypothetical protein